MRLDIRELIMYDNLDNQEFLDYLDDLGLRVLEDYYLDNLDTLDSLDTLDNPELEDIQW